MWPFRRKNEDDFSSGRFSVREAEPAVPADDEDEEEAFGALGLDTFFSFVERLVERADARVVEVFAVACST